MKIYDRSGFPNSARIRIVLAEKGLDAQIEFVSVDLIGAEHKQAAFLAKNPSGVLPVLELDDGTYNSESTAITEYLDNLDGNPTLTGKTPREKAVIHMMQRRADADLLDAVANYFHNATPGLGPILQVFKNPEWVDRKAWGEQERDKALNGMKYSDGVLRTHSYVAGEVFSMADITVFAGLMFADAAGIAIPEDYTALSAWRAKVIVSGSISITYPSTHRNVPSTAITAMEQCARTEILGRPRLTTRTAPGSGPISNNSTNHLLRSMVLLLIGIIGSTMIISSSPVTCSGK